MPGAVGGASGGCDLWRFRYRQKHLLQAICHESEQMGGKTAVCISIVELLPFGPDALAGLDSHDVICLDDLEHAAADPGWEEAVFHLYNRVLDRNGLLVVSLSEVPASLPFGLADLGSV